MVMMVLVLLCLSNRVLGEEEEEEEEEGKNEKESTPKYKSYDDIVNDLDHLRSKDGALQEALMSVMRQNVGPDDPKMDTSWMLDDDEADYEDGLFDDDLFLERDEEDEDEDEDDSDEDPWDHWDDDDDYVRVSDEL